VALNWNSISADDVRAALKHVGTSRTGNRTSGLVIIDGNRSLPAKEVLRLAYLLANKLPADTKIKFSSGDGTLKVLRSLGFHAERIDVAKGP
jgi:hypothetical protein